MVVCGAYRDRWWREVERLCDDAWLRLNIGPGGVAYGIENCVAELTAEGSSSTPAFVEGCSRAQPTASTCMEAVEPNWPEVCLIRPGPRPTGAPCAVSGQCASTICARQADSACAVCRDGVKEGLSCSDAEPCEAPLRCFNKRCSKDAGAGPGQPCETSEACTAGLVCWQGACSAASQEGEECKGGCDFLSHGLRCNNVTKKCERLTVAGPGSKCGLDTKTGSATACELNACTAANVCGAQVKLGEPCGAKAKGAVCVEGYCVNGVCSKIDEAACGRD